MKKIIHRLILMAGTLIGLGFIGCLLFFAWPAFLIIGLVSSVVYAFNYWFGIKTSDRYNYRD